MGRHFRTLYGYDTLTDELCGLRFEISPAAFFQVNPAQTEVLYQTALDFAELTGDERLCDVYCGAGTITLMMARHCREALGIEIVPQAIENAKENAVRNGIGNVNFRCGAAEALRLAHLTRCTCALLKDRSPSCGCGRIYDGTFTGTLTDGNGVAAELLLQNGIRVFGESQLDELLDFIRSSVK